ncbi:MAG: hypothetical protein L3K17_00685 [Thermoplasmata archaeon]|nr:hypothetical protein [Thermoplasmata archaeon]
MTTPPELSSTGSDTPPACGSWLITFVGLPPHPFEWLGSRFRTVLTEPSFRRLRWAILVGLVVRLVLAPLTSWSTDTTGFAQGDLSFVFQGSPYLGGTLFNPPLSAFLQLPLVTLLLLVYSPQQLITYAPGLLPSTAAIGPGFISPWVASPLMLVAIKLPLIAADVGTTLGLVWLARRSGRPELAPWLGIAFFLNPLAIWVSSVHAEPDGLAALLVVLLIVALAYGRGFLAGALLGLATFAKAYPLVLLPLAVAVLISARRSSAESVGRPIRRLAEFALGLVLVSAIFLPYLAFIPAVVGRPTVVSDFGGLSIFVMYNSGSPALGGFTHAWRSVIPGLVLLQVLELIAVGTAIVVAAGVGWRIRRSDIASSAGLLPMLSVASLATVTGLLLAYPAPQPENLLAIVPLGLASSLSLGRVSSRLTWIVSLSAFALYMVFGTPLEGFTPFILLLGPGPTAVANSVFVTYGHGGYGAPPGYFWFVPGIIAGAALLVVWFIAFRHSLPSDWRVGVSRAIGRLVRR